MSLILLGLFDNATIQFVGHHFFGSYHYCLVHFVADHNSLTDLAQSSIFHSETSSLADIEFALVENGLHPSNCFTNFLNPHGVF